MPRGSKIGGRGSEKERFWAKVNKDGPIPEHRPDLGPCWVWTACISHGYGLFGLQKKEIDKDVVRVRSHRWSYEHLVELIPEGLGLDHICRNKACVNPTHLEPVTHKENSLRSEVGFAAINARKTHCPKGHPLSGDNIYSNASHDRQCKTCTKDFAYRKYREENEQLNFKQR